MGRHPDPARLEALDVAGAGDERRELLEHLRSCGPCRARWVAADPARIFALLQLDDVPEAALERLSAGVMAGLEPAPHGSRFSARRSLGAIAASLLLCAAIAGYLRQMPPATSELAGTAAPATGTVETAATLGEPQTARASDPVRGVELISSPGGGRVVNLSVGDTRVVMIFDEELDL